MRSGGAGGPENGESFALLALVGGLDFALHLHTRAHTPRKHALVDGHEGPKRCMASGWNSGWNFHGPIHGQMGLRGGFWLAVQSRSGWNYRHGGGSYHQGRRSGALQDPNKPVPGDVTCTPPEMTIWLIWQVITRKPGKRGLRGWKICVGMGPYRRRSTPVQMEMSRACHAEKSVSWDGSLGEGKPRLSRIEATYRQTRRQDSRNCGLLASAEYPEVLASVPRESRNGD